MSFERPRETPSDMGPVGPTPARAPAGWDRSADLEKDPAVVPDLGEVDVPDELRAEMEAHMAKYPDRRSAVLSCLYAAQGVHGWCSPEAIRQVAAVMRVTPAYLSSIVTFYDMLSAEPHGRHYVYVCTSVVCNLIGAQAVMEAMEEEAEHLDDTLIRESECLGACDIGPMASVNGRYVGPLDPSDAPEIAAALREGRRPLPGRGIESEDFHAPAEVGPVEARDARHAPEWGDPTPGIRRRTEGSSEEADRREGSAETDRPGPSPAQGDRPGVSPEGDATEGPPEGDSA